MSNPRNNVSLVGRLAGDPKVFTNNDGSRKVLFSLFVDRNYVGSNGRISDALPVEAFVSAKAQGLGPYEYVHQGDQIAVQATLQHQTWTDKTTGAARYETKVVAEEISFLEPRSVTSARMDQRQAKQAATAAATAVTAGTPAQSAVAAPAASTQETRPAVEYVPEPAF